MNTTVNLGMDVEMSAAACRAAAYKTLCELSVDRGYTTEMPLVADRDLEAHVETTPVIVAATAEGLRVCVYLLGYKKVNVGVVRTVVAAAAEAEAAAVVIFVCVGITPSATQELYAAFPGRMEVFKTRELIRNVTHSRRYTPHVALDATETSNLKRSRNLKDEDLPLISARDAVVRYFGFPDKAVIHTVRHWKGLPPMDYYRIVARIQD